MPEVSEVLNLKSMEPETEKAAPGEERRVISQGPEGSRETELARRQPRAE